MNKSFIIASWIGAALIAGSAQAAEPASKAENAGLGAGAAIGAAVGGPVGAIAGATLGVVFGEKHRQVRQSRKAARKAKKELEAQTSDMNQLQAELTRSLHEIDSLTAENHELVSKQELIAQLQMEVLFQTAESVIDGPAAARLTDLATLVKTTPELTVRLDGYADPRGDEEYNLKLSAQRADSVKEVLIQAGVPKNRIRTYSQGEDDRAMDEKDLDALALTRRVTVRLLDGNSEHNVAQGF